MKTGLLFNILKQMCFYTKNVCTLFSLARIESGSEIGKCCSRIRIAEVKYWAILHNTIFEHSVRLTAFLKMVSIFSIFDGKTKIIVFNPLTVMYRTV